MGGVKLTVTFTNEREASDYLARVLDQLRRPKLAKAVNQVGRYWQANYKSEGGDVGGWAALAPSTIANRASQNYSSGPILYRHGSLYAMSAAFFANENRSTSRSASTPYDKRAGHATTVKLSLKDGLAVMAVKGPKVFNQWPAPSQGRPARQFWAMTPAMRRAARQGVIDWMVEGVILGRDY